MLSCFYTRLYVPDEMTHKNTYVGGVLMNNKGVGAVFCLIAAILMSARYLSAAVYMSNAVSWSSDLFQSGLSYIGAPLTIAAIVSLIAGIVFLVVGLYQEIRKPKEK